jgi:hypothetical protein
MVPTNIHPHRYNTLNVFDMTRIVADNAPTLIGMFGQAVGYVQIRSEI